MTCASTPASNAVFDVSSCDAMDPGAVLLLMNAGKTIQSQGGSLVIRGVGVAGGAFNALRKHLAHYRMPKADRSSIVLEPGDYPLRGVRSAGEMVGELKDWAECVQRTTDAPPEALALWRCHVAEVATNSFQHASGPARVDFGDVLLAGAADPRSKTVQLAVLDRGAGIPTVLRPTLTELGPIADAKIIMAACRNGVTSRCTPYNQGRGLYALVQAVRANHGHLQIFSGGGLVHVANRRMYSRSSRTAHALGGTLTIITVKGLST